jgi:predicted transcriptional regulator
MFRSFFKTRSLDRFTIDSFRCLSTMAKSDEKIPKGKATCDAKVKLDTNKAKKNKPKKQSAKHEEVKNKILKYMADVVTTEDTQDIPKLDVAVACGFASPGSHAFFYAWKDLAEDGKVEKSSKKGYVRLTKKGLESVPEGVVVAAPQDNAAKKEYFLAKLERCLKGKAPKDKIGIIVDVLHDGQPHTLDELCQATGWKGLSTHAFGYTMSALKKQGLAEESNKTYTLTDKWYPEGRP